MRIKRMLFTTALATLAVVPATTTLTPGIGSAHHPLVTAEASECILPDATNWVVDLTVTSDAPDRGKEYSVSPTDYQPAGWVNESIPFIRTVVVPITQASYTETVLVSWRSGDDYGPTQVSGTATVKRPPTCPPLNTIESIFVFCEEAGATNGSVPLSGTANGNPVSFAPWETLLFPYDDAGKLHLILMDGDTTVFDKVLSAPKGVGCNFSAEFVGSSDCYGVTSGTLSVNTDGIDSIPSYRLNSGEWVKMTDTSQSLSGITGLESIQVGYPESGPLVLATMLVVGPPAGSCDQPLTEPKPSATFTPPTCSADGSLVLNNSGTAPAEFTITYLSMPAGVASGFEVTLAPGETRVVPLNVELGRFSLVVESGGKTLVDGLLERPAVCAASQLPATGVGSWLIVGVASLLTILGGLLIGASRKRRRLTFI